MAYDIPNFVPGVYVAGADLSAQQYRAVKIDAGNDRTVVLAGAGEFSIGILQNKPDLNNCEACVMEQGHSPAVYAATIAAGDKVAVDANGEMIVAASGAHPIGFAVTGGDAGEICTISVVQSLTPLA